MYVSIKSWQCKKTGRTGPKVGDSVRYVGQTHQSTKAVLNRRRNSCIIVEAVSRLPGKVTISDLQQLKKEELKAECRTRQLLLGGTKDDLVQRLWDFVEAEQGKSQKAQSASSLESQQSLKKTKKPTKASASEVLDEPKTQPTKKPKSKQKPDENLEVEESEETKLETKSDATASTIKSKVSKKTTKSVAPSSTPKKSEKLESKLEEEEEPPVAKIKASAKKPTPTKKKTTDKQDTESELIKSKKSPEIASKSDVAKAAAKKTKQETEAKKEAKAKEPKTVKKLDTKDTTAQPKTVQQSQPQKGAPRRIVIKENLKKKLNSARDVIQIPAKAHEMIQERLQQQTEQKQKEEPPIKVTYEEKLEEVEEEEEEEIVPIESLEEKVKQQEFDDQFIMNLSKEKLEQEKREREKEQENLEREKKQKAQQAQQILAKKKLEETQKQQQVSLEKAAKQKEMAKKLIQSKKKQKLQKEKKEEDEDTVEVFQMLYMSELEDELSKKSARGLSLPWIPGKSDVGMEQFKTYEEFEKVGRACTSIVLYLSCGFWRIPVLQKQKKEVYMKALWNAFMVEKTHALPKQGQEDNPEESTQSEEKQRVKTRSRRKSGVKNTEADLKAASAAAAAASDVNEQEGREVDLRVESVGGSGPLILDEEDVTLQEDYSKDLELEIEEAKFDEQPEYMVQRPEGGISVFKESLEGPFSDEVSAEGNKDMDFEYHENQRLFSLMDSTAGYQAFSDDDVDIEEATDEEGDKLVWTKSDEEDFEIDMVEMIDQVGEDTLSELDNMEQYAQQIEDMQAEEESEIEAAEATEAAASAEGQLVENSAQEPIVEGGVVLESENPRKKPTMSKTIPQQSKQDSQSSDEEVASLDNYQRKLLGTVSRTPDISDSESEEEEIVYSSDQDILEEEEEEALSLGKSSEGVEIKEVKDSIDFKFPPDEDLKQAGEQIAEQIREEIIHKQSYVSDANPEDIKQGEIIAQQFRETILKETQQVPYNDDDKQRIQQLEFESGQQSEEKENFNEWILNVQNFRRSTPDPVSWYDEGKEIHKTLSLQQLDHKEEKQKYLKSVLKRLQDDYDVTFREQDYNVQNSSDDEYLQEKKIQQMDGQKVQTINTPLDKQQIIQDEQSRDQKLPKQKEEQINQSLQNVDDLRESGEVSSEADTESRKDITISEEKEDESKTMKISKEQQDEKDKTMKISQEQREKQKSQDVLAEGLKLIGKFFKPFL